MVAGFGARAHGLPAGTPLLAAGGALSAAGAYLFAYLIWRTLDGPATARPAERRPDGAAAPAGRARLPIAG
jgi:hypothetical protein